MVFHCDFGGSHVDISMILVAICEMHILSRRRFLIIALVFLEEVLNSYDLGGSILLLKGSIIEIIAMRCFFFQTCFFVKIMNELVCQNSSVQGWN